MRLALSKDNGDTWNEILDVETEPNREYSYPAAIFTADGGAAITYTWGRQNIVFVKIAPQDISKNFKSHK